MTLNFLRQSFIKRQDANTHLLITPLMTHQDPDIVWGLNISHCSGILGGF